MFGPDLMAPHEETASSAQREVWAMAAMDSGLRSLQRAGGGALWNVWTAA